MALRHRQQPSGKSGDENASNARFGKCGKTGKSLSAQVTKGGIPLEETDENLQSKKTDGLYFAGEILDVDGQCGGFNLQWAYASARTVAAAIAQKYGK